jgi:hypothetical protein
MKRRKFGPYFDMFLFLVIGASVGINIVLPSASEQVVPITEPVTPVVKVASCDEQNSDRCFERYGGMPLHGTPLFVRNDCAKRAWFTITGLTPCEFQLGEPFALCKVRGLSITNWWSHLDAVEKCCDGVDNNGDGIVDDDCDPLCRFGFPSNMQTVVLDGANTTVIVSVNSDDVQDAGSVNAVHLSNFSAGY